MRESPRGRVRFAEFSTRFPQAGHTTQSDPRPLGRKWPNSKYLYRMESLRQTQENNTTFIFWLLPSGIPGVCGEKVRESKSRGQGSEVRGQYLLADLWPLTPEPLLFHAFNAQESHCPQDGPRLGLGIRVADAVRQRRQGGGSEHFRDGDRDRPARDQGRLFRPRIRRGRVRSPARPSPPAHAPRDCGCACASKTAKCSKA